MQATNKREKFSPNPTPLRLTTSVRNFLDNKALQENVNPSIMYRKAIYAGIKELYNVEVIDNEIIQ